ncbi:MAG: HEAT repeat domain-containing protein [Planctomycetota bacterium]
MTVLLLLSASLLAQGVEVSVREALNPATDPNKRLALLQVIIESPEGEALLSEKGLDPELDAGVLHAVADAFFDAGKADVHIERIALLLLSEDAAVRTKVGGRFKSDVLDPARGETVALLLAAIAEKSEDPRARRAAVRMLGHIPLRVALRAIVDAWLRDADPDVRAECKEQSRGVLLARTARQADKALRTFEPWETYYDVLRWANNEQSRRLAELEGFRDEALKQGNAARAFREMGNGDSRSRGIAAERLRELAATGQFDPLEPKEFAGRAYTVFLNERDRNDRTAAILSQLLGALEELTKGSETPPLWSAVERKDLARALAPLAEAPQAWDEVGKACVSLLGTIGGEAASTLKAFASAPASVEVRREAVLGLGELARDRPEDQDYVGRALGDLLMTEKSARVRKSILYQLGSAPQENAVNPIRDFLFPTDAATAVKLTEDELTRCIEILRQIGSEESVAVLVETAEKHADPTVQLLAVREGLLAGTVGPTEEQTVLSLLKAIVLSREQAPEVRVGVVVLLGEKGGRSAHAVLDALGADEALDDEIGTAVVEAKLRLAERLMGKANGEPVTPPEIEVAVRLLDEAQSTGDPQRLEKLAGSILAKADAGKFPAGRARFLRAQIHARRPDATPERKLALYREAAESAAADRLPPDSETALLLEYLALLKEGTQDKERSEAALRCLEKLAVLAGEDRRRAVGYFLDAAACAAGELGDSVEAERLLKEAEARAPLEQDLKARLDKIRAGLAATPPEKKAG